MITSDLSNDGKMHTTSLQALFPVSWNEVSALWYEISIEGLQETSIKGLQETSIEGIQEPGEGPDLIDSHTLEASHTQEASNTQAATYAQAASLLGRMLFALEARLEFVLSEMECPGGNRPIGEDSLSGLKGQAACLVGIAEEDTALLSLVIQELEDQLRQEYAGTDDALCIRVQEKGAGALPAMHPVDQQKAIFYLIQLPSGIQKMSGIQPGQADLSVKMSGIQPGQADLSVSMDGVLLLPDGLRISTRVDSRTESAGNFLADKITYLTEFLGGEI